MKRLALILLASLLVVPVWLGQPEASNAQKAAAARYRPDRILVKLRPGEPARDSIGDEILSLRGTRAESTSVDGVRGPQIVHLNNQISVAAALSRATRDPS